MPQYRLYYFNLRGRAEVARYIMAVGDIEYEDVRFTFEQWPENKNNMPFGQVPVLEVDGEKISQSRAIFRYLAKQAGLAGKTDLEAARIDMRVECADEITDLVGKVYKEPDQVIKEELRKKVREELLPGVLEKLEKLLVANGGGDGYLVGNEMTWADIVLANDFDGPKFIGINTDEYTAYPKLMALAKRVKDHPKIAAWIAKRPETEH